MAPVVRSRPFALSAALVLTWLVGSCSPSRDDDTVAAPASDPGAEGPVVRLPRDDGSVVSPPIPEASRAERARLLAVRDEAEKMTAADFAKKYAVPFAPAALPFDPLTAAGLPALAKTSLALNKEERAVLARRGFVLSEAKRFPTFGYGYLNIYVQDLPVYVSADSILFAVHRSYDKILAVLETAVLVGELEAMVGAMRRALAGAEGRSLPPRTRGDLDLYLTVADSLLRDKVVPAADPANDAAVARFVGGAKSASGIAVVDLFGVPREEDFSQFKPRGHYNDTPVLQRYFRATMWLGRVDLRILETQPDGTRRFHRRQLDAALAFREVATPAARASWSKVMAAVEAFVGEPDSMVLPQLDLLLADLGVTGFAGVAGVSDARIAETIALKGYGAQRIASRILVKDTGNGETFPLDASFTLLPQRYVVDSHVFSNVVFDRVRHGRVYRMMPDPLDVAFAALHNDQAGALLAPEITKHGYAPDLHTTRFLVEAHEPAYWSANLYTLWLGALRALSPAGELAKPTAAGLPSVAATEAWGRRVINTQLASWAELRHDTILYAKQSYTAGDGCVFPDAYVDPYPAFYDAIGALAKRGRALIEALAVPASLGGEIDRYFGRLTTVAQTLGDMARNQRAGKPLAPEHLAFINRIVSVEGEPCGGPATMKGWYIDLFFRNDLASKWDPTIADVHTQPREPGGVVVGKVLHVGTGAARLMVVTVDTCGAASASSAKAYVGLASSYFEKTTTQFKRLTDQEWSTELAKTPDDVPWMRDLVVR